MDGNFSFFVLSDAVGSPPAKIAIDTAGNPLRKRQPHHKSRSGCTTCKRRKVKCDETPPACLNCTKRKLQCSFKAPSEPMDAHSRGRTQATPISGPSQNSPAGPLVLLDRLSGEYPEIELSCLFPLPTPGFGVALGDNGASIYQAENACHLQRPSRDILDRHSRNYREVACSACFLRAGLRIEEMYDIEENSPVYNLAGLAPRMSSTERELFLHFEKFTSKNLGLSTTLWGTDVLRSALQCDFVMSALFLVAAAHMNHNLPAYQHNRKNHVRYVSSALSGLRGALTSEMTITNFESIINCATLFIHYAWTCMENDLNVDIDLAVFFSQTADHFLGLKDCIIVAQDVFRQTKWAMVLLYSPKINLERYLMESQSMADQLEDVFLHCLACGLGSKVPENACIENVSAIRRLIIPLNVICISSPDIESTGLMSDLHRYLFTWPTCGRMSTRGFILQVGEGNLVSLTILLYYYAAILRVYTEKIWWMRDGATIMFNKLRSKLSGRCSRCTDIPLSLLALPRAAGGCS